MTFLAASKTSFFFLLSGHQSADSGSTLYPGLILTSAKTLFLKQVIFRGTGYWDSDMNLGGGKGDIDLITSSNTMKSYCPQI